MSYGPPIHCPAETLPVADVPHLFESNGRDRTLSIRLLRTGKTFPVFVPNWRVTVIRKPGFLLLRANLKFAGGI
jgi:hypothetical protein